MRTVYSDRHKAYRPKFDIVNGVVTETASPWRNAEIVLNALRRDLKAEILTPADHGRTPIGWVHDPAYVAFLETAWDEWVRAYGDAGEALPLANVQRGMRQAVPETIEGKLSYYAFDTGTPIGPGTWEAAYWSAQVAVDAARRLAANREPVFALSRPGGHHAGYDYYGGYCFLATESLAIETLCREGVGKIAYLDVDYHHCNGTQAIFYERDDVLTVSIHCDPRHDYPYFSGFADETGTGRGAGCNLNIPLPPGTTWSEFDPALARAQQAIADFGADALVVLAGVDTFEKDSICKFELGLDDFPGIGRAIADLDLPTVFVKGGGYCEEGLDRCVTAMLGGYMA